ncbi:MAG TPA: FKBP-type peptidyl-prolyl cis-trans isomerase, partial [Yinghuangia sp.]|nr:FKBP-type peptidyl-prolyl cis-trans isomerase [Yinghuangia sp.]
LLIVPALTLGAAACGDDEGGGSDPSPTASSSAPPRSAGLSTTSAATANPAFGQAPDLKIPDGPPPTGLGAQVLTEGTGAVVSAQDLVNANYEGVSWSTKKVFDSSFERGEPAEFYLESVIKGWTQGLAGKKVGSRVLLTIPGDLGYGAAGKDPDIKSNETLVFVVDIIGTRPGYATGTPVAPNPDLPTVTTDGNKVVGLTFPAGKAAPTALVSQPLIEGAGAPVGGTDQVEVQLLQWLWGSPTMLGSTWGGSGPTALPLGQADATPVMQSITEALTGKKVGSRVMVVMPPDRGFGAAGDPSQNIPANSTFVVVVDIVKSGPATTS